MELRHLKYFLAVAEELHFARAAEKLHIEQSPLSRAIKELEEELGVVLFARTTRSTRLTRAGKLFLEHARRVFAVLQQARDSVKAAAKDSRNQTKWAMASSLYQSGAMRSWWLCRLGILCWHISAFRWRNCSATLWFYATRRFAKATRNTLIGYCAGRTWNP